MSYLKINFLVIGISLLILIILVPIVLSIPKNSTNGYLMFGVLLVGGIAMLGLGMGIWATISDAWRVEVRGEEIEGVKREGKRIPKERAAKSLFRKTFAVFTDIFLI